jgi:hypothetical protein
MGGLGAGAFDLARGERERERERGAERSITSIYIIIILT